MARRPSSRQTKKTLAAFSPEQLRAIHAVAEEAAERAAKRAAYRVVKETSSAAVYETLTALGFRADTSEARDELHGDAKFIRKLRIAAETNPAKYGFALFTFALTVFGAVIVYGVQQFLNPLFGK
jgi:hypothetical protein